MSGLLKLASSLRRGCATNALRLAIAVAAIMLFSFLTISESRAGLLKETSVAAVNDKALQKHAGVPDEVAVTSSGKASLSNVATTTDSCVSSLKCCGSDHGSGTCAASGYCPAFFAAIMTGTAIFAPNIGRGTYGWPQGIAVAPGQLNPDFRPPRTFS